jgi:hypothetical protein
MKVARSIVPLALVALIVAAPVSAVASPATKEYTPKEPTVKGKGPSGGPPGVASGSVDDGTVPPAQLKKLLRGGPRAEAVAKELVADVDTEDGGSLLRALLDPLVLVLALAMIVIAGGARRLRGAV